MRRVLARRRACLFIASYTISRHIGEINLGILRHAPRQRREFHTLQKRDQFSRIRLMDREIVERHVERDVIVEQHELARDACLVGVFD